MTHIKFLVCEVLRLDLNADYERLHELVNQHKTLREMLGHDLYDEAKQYAYQALVDRRRPALIKKCDAALRGRCDSFVVKADVHFPTGINLLWDAMRKAITLIARWCESRRLSDWRQYRYNLRQLKRLMRCAQNKKRRKAKAGVQQSNAQMIQAYQTYIDQARCHLNIIQITLTELP